MLNMRGWKVLRMKIIIKGLEYVSNYFSDKEFEILKVEEKGERILILAKDLRSGSNESYIATHGELKKLFHDKRNKRNPWEYRTIMFNDEHEHSQYIKKMKSILSKDV